MGIGAGAVRPCLHRRSDRGRTLGLDGTDHPRETVTRRQPRATREDGRRFCGTPFGYVGDNLGGVPILLDEG